MRVYLAGGITGLTFERAAGWRRELIAAYPEIEWLDPLRGKDHLGNGNRPLPSDFEGDGQIAAVWQDLDDIDRCDAVLMNLMYTSHASIGTMAELGYAFAREKPCHVAVDEGGVHDHLFVRVLAATISRSLVDAVEEVLG